MSTPYPEVGERLLSLNPYPEYGERALIINPDDPLVPSKLARLELRTVMESWRPAGGRITSSRDVERFAFGWDYPDGTMLVLCLNAKNVPNQVGTLRDASPSVETFRDVCAMALLTGSHAVILVLRDEGDRERALAQAEKYTAIKETFSMLGLHLLDINIWFTGAHDHKALLSLLDEGLM